MTDLPNKNLLRPDEVVEFRDIFDITLEEKLSLKWKVVDANETVAGWTPEDISIFTIDDREVVGCSEWMRADRELFEHIVAIHNESVDFDTRINKCKANHRRGGL